MEYDYRTAGAAATRAMAEATKATNILNTLTRSLTKTTPQPTPASELKVPPVAAPPHELPAAMAEGPGRRVARPLSVCCRLMFAIDVAYRVSPMRPLREWGSLTWSLPILYRLKFLLLALRILMGNTLGLPMLQWPKVRPLLETLCTWVIWPEER